MSKRWSVIFTAVVFLAALMAAFTSNALIMNKGNVTKDKEGHVLVSLWKEYESVRRADRPLERAKVLSKIIDEASAKRCHWDFYDAWSESYSVRSNRDWKSRDSLYEAFASAVKAYDEPVVTLAFAIDYSGESVSALSGTVAKEKARLQAGRNQEFYHAAGVASNMNGLLGKYVRDDYEFALWALYFRGRWKESEPELKAVLGDSYPNAKFLEFDSIGRTLKGDELKAAYGKFSEENASNAMGLFAGSALLSMRRDSLRQEKGATSEDYKALLADCQAFERKRASFSSGVDREIALVIRDVDYTVKNLNAQSLNLLYENGTVKVLFRNMGGAYLEVALDSKNPKPIISRKVENPARSFYVYDTVAVDLPAIGDGSYYAKVKEGKVSRNIGFEKKTLSIALREDSEGVGVYVADYKSGEPVAKADFELFCAGKSLAKVEGVVLDGFTHLPSRITSAVRKNAMNVLVASFVGSDGLLRQSREVSYPMGDFVPRSGLNSVPERGCDIFLDRGAYNPGDTVKFKAVFRTRMSATESKVFEAGGKVRFSVTDPERNVVATIDAVTNEFGSAAGDFVIPKGLRNGYFTLVAECGKTEGSASFRVDEYVLPTFDLVFDKSKEIFLVGDTVTVKGRLKSYSGHPLSSAEARYVVTRYGTRVSSGEISIGEGGDFTISFPSGDSDGHFFVEVTVSDGTGETHKFSASVWVSNHFGIRLGLRNGAAGMVNGDKNWRLVTGGEAKIEIGVVNNDGESVAIPVRYELLGTDGSVLARGTVESMDTIAFSLPKAGAYELRAEASKKNREGVETKAKSTLDILRVSESDSNVGAKVESVIIPVGACADGELDEGDSISLRLGAADGPVWAVVELFGDHAQALSHQVLRLEGDGSLSTVEYQCPASYPDGLLVKAFYFKNGWHRVYDKEFTRTRKSEALGLSFERFHDKTLPGNLYEFVIKTNPGVEAVASVFDKSVETIAPNVWRARGEIRPGVLGVWINALDGNDSARPVYDYVVGYGGRNSIKMASRASVMLSDTEDAVVVEEMADMAEAPAPVPMMKAAGDMGINGAADVKVRSDFATTLAFEPFLRSGKDGKISLSVRTSDKVSTYLVQLYAHDKAARDAALRQEMLVTMPVKIEVAEPKYLYKGDSYSPLATLSNISESDVAGTVTLYTYDTEDYASAEPTGTYSREVSLTSSSSVPLEFESVTPEGDVLGLKVVFSDAGGKYSDAVFVSFPLLDARQAITESHSAVYLAGMDKDSLMRAVASKFTGTTSAGAEYIERDIRSMLMESLPAKAEPSGNDVLSLCEAFALRLEARGLGAKFDVEVSDSDLFDKILACRNADGGFAWFEGMRSSPVITAVVLERFAKLRGKTLPDGYSFDGTASVKYLDKEQFTKGEAWPFWCGHMSYTQYAFVRSLYADVAFNVDGLTKNEKGEYTKIFKEFQKEIKEYLLPSKKNGRGLDGRILAKARRVRILMNLSGSPEGLSLARKWGLSLSAESKMEKSLIADMRSLLEYAVEHPDGGWYYPNAVMPWRGLLESELYAHSMLCDLLSGEATAGMTPAERASANEIADGIRLWIMLQKETQRWDSDPAYVEAIGSVLSGPESVLSTSVMALTKTYEKPVAEIVPAGNGFTIERRFYREATSPDGTALREDIAAGDWLRVGDKVICEYKVWSQENRSFVKLTAPREACFRPAEQLSGHYGWSVRPLRVGGSWTVSPQGYRNVKSDRTEYFFDVYPEEKTSVTETFFVTQEGSFSAPVVTIESLYAPHYRANDGFSEPVKSAKRD